MNEFDLTSWREAIKDIPNPYHYSWTSPPVYFYYKGKKRQVYVRCNDSLYIFD